MAQPYRIVDLSSFTALPNGIPTGSEIAEISNAGAGSFQAPLAVVASSRKPTYVSAAGTTVVSGGDYGDFLVTTTGAVIFSLPAAADRQGVPVSIVDRSGTPNITINPNGVETIIGLASITLTTPYGGFTLWPDTTGAGWYQK